MSAGFLYDRKETYGDFSCELLGGKGNYGFVKVAKLIH